MLVYHLTGKVKDLPRLIHNWNELPENVIQTLITGEEYRVYENQELIIYNGYEVAASCTIEVIQVKDIKYTLIKNCWTVEGCIWEDNQENTLH